MVEMPTGEKLRLMGEPGGLRGQPEPTDGQVLGYVAANRRTEYINLPAAEPIATQLEAEAGTGTSVRRWTPERIGQAIAALAASGSGNSVFAQGTAPTATAVGDLWFNTSDGNKQYRWNGSSWAAVDDSRIATNAAAIASQGSSISSLSTTKTQTFAQGTAPTAGAIGDLWIDTANNNQPKRWDGSTWATVRDATIAAAQTTADGKNQTFIQGTAPTATAAGDLWFDTANGHKLYRWSGSAWVAVDDARIGSTAATVSTLSTTVATNTGAIATLNTNLSSVTTTKSQTFAQSGTPTAGAVGDIWIDTGNGNLIKRWNGSSWAALQDSGIGTAQSAASAAQSTADSKVKTWIQGTAPTASTTGDLWVNSSDNNKLYRWNGSSWVLVADSRITTNSADISTLQTTVTTQGTSLASLTTSVSVAQSTADSKVKTWIQGTAPTASAAGDIWIDTANGSALKRWDGSSWVNTTVAQGAIDFVSAQVTTEQSTRISEIGAIHAQWGVKIDVNGRISGRVNLDGTNASSTFLVAVDKFVVANANGTVTAMDIRPGGNIVFGADVQSDNFSTGSAGWLIKYNGDAEFNNVVVRGTLNATDIVAGTVATARLPADVVNANIGSYGSGGTRSSTSYGALTSGSPIEVTVTCDGFKRKVTYSAAYIANASGSTQTCYAALYMDGSTLIAELANGSGVSLVSGQSIPLEFSGYITPSAGSHTFQLYIKSSAGNSCATGGEISVS